jgi:chromosome segregation ATPase
VWKNRIVSFAIGLSLGILGTAGFLSGGSGNPGGLAELDRAGKRETARIIGDFERTIGEQRNRINSLETRNNRLEANNRDARAITKQLTISASAETTNIRSAIILHKEITDQVKSLDGILSRGDTGGDSGDGVSNIQDLQLTCP